MRYKKNTEFRTPDENYWEYIFCISSTTQQKTPLMVFPGGSFKTFLHTRKLFDKSIREKMPKDTLILHAWPGTWRTDVFSYSLESFQKAFKKAFKDNFVGI